MLLKKYKKINYSDLPAKAKETYNFQKASAILADYGFVTNLLKYDWMGADFLAQHIDGDWLKIQLKGRLTTKPEYEGKDLFIMFEDKDTSQWYLFPHDKLTKYCRDNYPDAVYTIQGHSRGKLSTWEKEWLIPYAIPRVSMPLSDNKFIYKGREKFVEFAYDFADRVGANISSEGDVYFANKNYFRSFILKLCGEVEELCNERFQNAKN
jgi:hypothetical protein